MLSKNKCFKHLFFKKKVDSRHLLIYIVCVCVFDTCHLSANTNLKIRYGGIEK